MTKDITAGSNWGEAVQLAPNPQLRKWAELVGSAYFVSRFYCVEELFAAGAEVWELYERTINLQQRGLPTFVTVLGRVEDQYRGLKKAELVQLCKKSGLRSDGLKSDLLKRLWEDRRMHFEVVLVGKGTPPGWLDGVVYTCVYTDEDGEPHVCPSLAERYKTGGICKHILAVADKSRRYDLLAWIGVQEVWVKNKARKAYWTEYDLCMLNHLPEQHRHLARPRALAEDVEDMPPYLRAKIKAENAWLYPNRQ